MLFSRNIQEKTEEAVVLCNTLKAFQPFMSETRMHALIAYFASDFEAKLKLAKAPKKFTEQLHAFQN